MPKTNKKTPPKKQKTFKNSNSPKSPKNKKLIKEYVNNIHDFKFDIKNDNIIYYKNVCNNNKIIEIEMGTYTGFEKNTNSLDIANVYGIPQVIFEKNGAYIYENFEPNAFYCKL